MNTELYKDILNSRIIKFYNWFQKNTLGEYTLFSIIKWCMFFAFIIGGLVLITTDTPPMWSRWLMGLIFIPSVIYALVGGIVHYLAGRKVRYWVKKYNLSFDFITNQIYIIHEQTNNNSKTTKR
jgi:hypothetical protein